MKFWMGLLFALTLLVVFGCGESSTPPDVTVPGCTPLPVSTAGDDQYILKDGMSPQEAWIGADSAQDGSTYSWSPALALSAADKPEVMANPTQSTEYKLTVSNKCGSASSKVNVFVLAE